MNDLAVILAGGGVALAILGAITGAKWLADRYGRRDE